MKKADDENFREWIDCIFKKIERKKKRKENFAPIMRF